MPIVVSVIPNSALGLGPFDFRSVSEYIDLPVLSACDPDSGNALFGTAADYFCQEGCNEDQFMYIVEPGDHIPLQFHAAYRPTVGWRSGAGDYLIGLDIMRLDGTVAWSGDIEDIADNFNTGIAPGGVAFQNVNVSVDKLIELTGLECFALRAAIPDAYVPSTTADADSEPGYAVAPGYIYIDVTGFSVYQWSGTAWAVIGPNEVGELWYVLSAGAWYRWTGTGWEVLADKPAPETPTFTYLTSMGFGMRRCNEDVVRFRSEQGGTDCIGFFHGTVGHEYAMEPVDGLRFVDYFYADSLSAHMDAPIGTTAIRSADEFYWTRTAYGWSYGATEIGDHFLVMNDTTGHFAGDVVERIEDIGAGNFQANGTFADYSGDVFDNAVLIPWAYQHDFKVRGTCRTNAFTVARELTKNGRLVSSDAAETVQVRTYGMPEVVAGRVNAVRSAPLFYICERQFIECEDLQPNNDEGLHWWLDFTATGPNCAASTSCG